MDVFNDVYDAINDMVEKRVEFEKTVLNVTDDETIAEIELNAAKYYYDNIIKMINVVIDRWKV